MMKEGNSRWNSELSKEEVKGKNNLSTMTSKLIILNAGGERISSWIY